MISLSRNAVYTDSTPVCPWVTSRPPRKLSVKKQGKCQRKKVRVRGQLDATFPKDTGVGERMRRHGELKAERLRCGESG